MDNFNLTSYYRKQYLIEAEGEEKLTKESLITSISNSIPEDTSVKDFAVAVGAILKDSYGKQNFNSFMDTLHTELGMESLKEESSFDLENKELSNAIKDEFEIDNYITMFTPDMGKVRFETDDIRDEFEQIKKFLEGKGLTITKSYQFADDGGKAFINFNK